MADDSEFITKLIGFGLSEKEALVYLHLLKYGPEPPSLLAKSLKTYREDVYRTLTGLINKGMVNPSLETPTVYTAVELDIALEAAFKKHETELGEMERRKQELQELSKQQKFRPSDEFSTFKIIKSVKELVAVTATLVASLQEEFLYVTPADVIALASLFGITEAAKKVIERGGEVRGVTNVTYSIIEAVQELLDIGEDVRHLEGYRGIYFGVLDRRMSFTAINVDTAIHEDVWRISLDEAINVLLTDDPTYAQYLVSTFELLWEQSVPAAQRIKELLKEGSQHV
jgi:sugar-specific transcriptional regulator TrmB